jgi:hypothetical protein
MSGSSPHAREIFSFREKKNSSQLFFPHKNNRISPQVKRNRTAFSKGVKNLMLI